MAHACCMLYKQRYTRARKCTRTRSYCPIDSNTWCCRILSFASPDIILCNFSVHVFHFYFVYLCRRKFLALVLYIVSSPTAAVSTLLHIRFHLATVILAPHISTELFRSIESCNQVNTLSNTVEYKDIQRCTRTATRVSVCECVTYVNTHVRI